MKKRLKIAAMVLGGVLLVALAVLWINLSSIVKKGIETMGPKMTKCAVTVESVSLSPLTGSGTIRGLVVGNPEGFKTDHALSLKEVHVDVAVTSLLTGTVVVEEVLIDAPDIIYEMGLGSSNLGRIQKNVEEASGPAKPGAEPAPDEGGGKKVRIDHLLVKDGRISLSAKLLGGKAVPVPLPDLEMRDIGKESDGASVAEVVSQVLTRLVAGVADAAKSGGSLIKEGASGLIDGVNKLFK